MNPSKFVKYCYRHFKCITLCVILKKEKQFLEWLLCNFLKLNNIFIENTPVYKQSLRKGLYSAALKTDLGIWKSNRLPLCGSSGDTFRSLSEDLARALLGSESGRV